MCQTVDLALAHLAPCYALAWRQSPILAFMFLGLVVALILGPLVCFVLAAFTRPRRAEWRYDRTYRAPSRRSATHNRR